jgi:predicted dinucleotide-utilizing enzyme
MSVFLSYAMTDKSRIKKVIGELKVRGILNENEKIIHASDVFVEGSSVRAQMREAIEAASKVVIIWSGAGAESDWVNYETGLAEALGKPIFLAVPKREAGSLPRKLENTQVIELENVS